MAARHGGDGRRRGGDLRRSRRGDRPEHLESAAGDPGRAVDPGDHRDRGAVLLLGLDRLHPAGRGRGAGGGAAACGRVYGVDVGEGRPSPAPPARGRAAGHGRLRGGGAQVHPPPSRGAADHLRRVRQAVQAGGRASGSALRPVPGRQGVPRRTGPARAGRTRRWRRAVAEANTGLAALQLCAAAGVPLGDLVAAAARDESLAVLRGAPVAVDVICIDRAGMVVGTGGAAGAGGPRPGKPSPLKGSPTSAPVRCATRTGWPHSRCRGR